MTIHIYSDSFGAKNRPDTWLHELEKLQNQKVICNGKGGTGPNWSLRKLIIDLENSVFNPRDFCIILLSDQKRMEFPWLKSDSHQLVYQLQEELETPPPHTHKYKIHLSEIETVAKTLGPMFLYENVKNITFLHLLSKQFNSINFLVFTCFDLDCHTSKYKNFNITSTKLLEDLDFNYLNNDNFYYVSTPVSYMIDVHTGKTFPNHMTKEHNKKFALICDTLLERFI